MTTTEPGAPEDTITVTVEVLASLLVAASEQKCEDFCRLQLGMSAHLAEAWRALWTADQGRFELLYWFLAGDREQDPLVCATCLADIIGVAEAEFDRVDDH